MKKLFSILLTVCIALSAFSVGFVFASAEGTLIKGTDVSWSYDPETHVLFFDGEGAIPDYNDFETTGGVVNVKYPWKGLGYTSIVFGEGVTGIGNYAFCYSSSLERVTLPKSIATLGKGIFLNCKNLEIAIIKAKSGSVSDNMFAGCDKLTTVELLSGVKSVDYRAFYNCSALKSIVIPEGVTSIGEDAFYQCTSLASVEMADSVKTIGKHAFYSCEKLNSLKLGKGLEKIDSNAFDNCRSLKSVVIPEKVSIISSAAFSGCQQLETVVLPENLKEIQTKAFNYCYVLKKITVSGKTENIGSNAFGYGKYGYAIDGFTVEGYDGSAAEKYAKDNGFTFVSLGDYYSGKCGENIEWKFDKATGTLSITGSGTLGGFDTENLPAYAKRFAGEVKAVNIDEKITAIGDYAFAGVTPADVTLSAAVESIGSKAFGDAKPVISAYYKSAAHKFADDNGLKFVNLSPNGQIGEKVYWLYDEEEKTVVIYGEGETYSTYTAEALPIVLDGKDVSKVEVGTDVTALYDNILVFSEPFSEITFGAELAKLGEKAFGFIKNADPEAENKYVPYESLKVTGYRSTPVKAYCEKNGFEFVDLEPAPAEFPEIKLGEAYPAVTDEKAGQILFYSSEVGTADFINALNKDDFTSVTASTETVSTGTVITFEAAGEKKEFTVIIPGDINGDGRVNSSDALAVLQHSVGSKLLEGEKLLAAEMTNDGSLNSADALAVLQIAVGRYQLTDFMKKAESAPPAEVASMPSDTDKIA